MRRFSCARRAWVMRARIIGSSGRGRVVTGTPIQFASTCGVGRYCHTAGPVSPDHVRIVKISRTSGTESVPVNGFECRFQLRGHRPRRPRPCPPRRRPSTAAAARRGAAAGRVATSARYSAGPPCTTMSASSRIAQRDQSSPTPRRRRRTPAGRPEPWPRMPRGSSLRHPEPARPPCPRAASTSAVARADRATIVHTPGVNWGSSAAAAARPEGGWRRGLFAVSAPLARPGGSPDRHSSASPPACTRSPRLDTSAVPLPRTPRGSAPADGGRHPPTPRRRCRMPGLPAGSPRSAPDGPPVVVGPLREPHIEVVDEQDALDRAAARIRLSTSCTTSHCALGGPCRRSIGVPRSRAPSAIAASMVDRPLPGSRARGDARLPTVTSATVRRCRSGTSARPIAIASSAVADDHSGRSRSICAVTLAGSGSTRGDAHEGCPDRRRPATRGRARARRAVPTGTRRPRRRPDRRSRGPVHRRWARRGIRADDRRAVGGMHHAQRDPDGALALTCSRTMPLGRCDASTRCMPSERPRAAMSATTAPRSGNRSIIAWNSSITMTRRGSTVSAGSAMSRARSTRSTDSRCRSRRAG